MSLLSATSQKYDLRPLSVILTLERSKNENHGKLHVLINICKKFEWCRFLTFFKGAGINFADGQTDRQMDGRPKVPSPVNDR